MVEARLARWSIPAATSSNVPGQPPPKAQADPSAPVVSVLMVRDLGALRQPAAVTALSCGTLLGGLAATRIFNWSNGQSSTFSYNRAINDVGDQTTVTFTGTIVSGRFAGCAARR